MEDTSRKRSLTSSVITEIIIALILVILILGTLNYFAILPLSRTFPFFSFLPQQSASINGNEVLQQGTRRNIVRTTVNSIIRPYAPLRLENNSNATVYSYIASSSSKLNGQARIDIQISVSDNASTSGVLFKNDKTYEDADYRHIRVFRDPVTSSWLLEYRADVKSNYTFLTKVVKGADFKSFAMIVSPDGMNLTVISPLFASKTIKLPSSLYKGGNKINAVSQVGPRSTITIFYLAYQVSIGAL